MVKRQDCLTLFACLGFGFGLIGLIAGIGAARGWGAISGLDYDGNSTAYNRFLPEPTVEEPGVKGRFGVEATGRWYFWKTNPALVTAVHRFSYWFLYVTHQTSIWYILYLGHKNTKSYSYNLNRYNVASIAVNTVFHLLHLLQTHITYDGLAQDVSIASSQGSVIMLLVFVLLMEYKERGAFFRWPCSNNKESRWRLSPEPIELVRKYHGYGFSWAAIYTFWYHPMENTIGHYAGFIYTWIILVQGSLFFTHVHLNRWWRLCQEVMVIVHGGLVAWQTGITTTRDDPLMGTLLWPMFTFGFLLVFFFTQIYSFPEWDRWNWKWRAVPPIIYLIIILANYSWIPDKEGRKWVRIQEVIRIPAIEYLFMIGAWFLLWVMIKIRNRIGVCYNKYISAAAFIVTYGGFVVLSYLIQELDVQIGLINAMILFVFVFIFGTCLTTVFFIDPQINPQ